MEKKQAQHIRSLIRKYTQEVYTQQEAKDLLDSFQTEGKPIIEEEMDYLWEETFQVDFPVEGREMDKEEARRLLQRINKKERQFTLRSFLKYAAVIAVLIISGLTYYLLPGNEDWLQPDTIVVETKRGERKELVLPDGSHITLNASTRLVYPETFVLSERKIEIDGEAYLEIQPNAEKPFIIHTQHMDVEVLGTSFNVKAYETDEQLSVSVRSGKVRVALPEAVLSLVADEELIWDRESDEFYKSKHNILNTISWLHGGLYFNRTPIGAVVKELQRIYDKEIVFEEGVNIKERVYGAHENKSLESVLKSIQYTTGIKYRKEGEVFILYK